MKTFLFILIVVVILAAALFVKHHRSADPSVALFEKPAEASRWDTVLTGKWKIHQQNIGEVYKWETDLDIQFFEAGKFKFFGEEKITFIKRDELQYKNGGGATGDWRPLSDSAFVIKSSDCSISPSYSKDDYNKTMTRFSCDSLSTNGIIFGAKADIGMEMTIVLFNRDTIEMTGKSYTNGETIQYFMTRVAQ